MADVTGVVAWLTGLPSSGKSTLARAIAGELRLRGIEAVILDSDEIRAAMFPGLGYDDAARTRLYGALARLAALIARQGHVALVPATANRRAFRDAARALAPAFVEIFVDTPLAECQRRDAKGLYATGVALGEYEAPPAPEIRVRPADEAAAAVIAARLADLL